MEQKEREIKESKSENEIDLSEKERKILKELAETEYYTKETKVLLRKLLLELRPDILINIIHFNTDQRPDNISIIMDSPNITKDQIKKLTEYIIDNIKPEKYLSYINGEIRSKSLYDQLTRSEKILLDELADAESFNPAEELDTVNVLIKLLQQLSTKDLKTIIEKDKDEFEFVDDDIKAIIFSSNNITNTERDKLIHYIIHIMSYNNYSSYFTKRKVNINNLRNLIKKIPGDYGKIVLYWFDKNREKLEKKDLELNVFIDSIESNPNTPLSLLLQIGDNNIISSNPSITISDIKKHPEIKWDYSLLSSNSNMTWKFIQETMDSKEYKKIKNDDDKWSFFDLSTNKCITFDIIKKNPNYGWPYGRVGYNPNITLDIVKENPIVYIDNDEDSPDYNEEIYKVRWDPLHLARNPNFTLKDILENPAIFPKNKWDKIFHSFLFNKNLNIKIVLEYKDIFTEDDWSLITINPGISIEDIANNPQLDWIIKDILWNPNITYKTVIENKWFDTNNIKDRSLVQNQYGYDGYAKHRKDVKFPRYWLTVHYLYKYIYTLDKPLLDVYNVARFIMEDTLNEQTKAVELSSIPKNIVEYNENYGNSITAYEGFICNAITIKLTRGYKIKLNFKITRDMIESFAQDYFENEGGFHITVNKEEFDKKICGDDKEFFTQEDFKDIEDKNLVSFELNKQIFCLTREDLIGFWNQELDETGTSGAINYGDCKYNEDDEVYEDTCKKFYKLPIPATYISEKTKNQIEKKKSVRVWKLVFDKNVRMGRGLHYIGEYANPAEPIYIAEVKSTYKRV